MVNPWFIACAVMLATFMEVLDTSVAKVALNHIAGNLYPAFVAPDEPATWVLTSLSCLQRDRASGDWLVGIVFFGREKVFDHLHRDLHDLVRALRFGQQPRYADSGPGHPGGWRRSAPTNCPSYSPGKFSAGEAGISAMSVYAIGAGGGADTGVPPSADG